MSEHLSKAVSAWGGAQDPDRDQLLALKAIAVLMVVVDHNDALRLAAPLLFPALTFHVSAFFFAALCVTLKNGQRWPVFARQRVGSYVPPFLIFYGLSAASQVALGAPWNLEQFMTGLWMGSFGAIKKGCGLAVLWFLPALLSFVLLLKLVRSWPWTRLLVYPLTACMVVSPELVTQQAQARLPWGIPVAFYTLGLSGLVLLAWRLSRWMSLRAGERPQVQALGWLLAGLLLQAAQNMRGTVVEIGDLTLFGLKDPSQLLLTISTNLCVLLGLCGLAPMLLRIPGLRHVGGRTLEIYLIHQFIMVPLLMVSRKSGWLQGWPATTGLLTVMLAAFGSLALAWALQHYTPKVYHFVFRR